VRVRIARTSVVMAEIVIDSCAASRRHIL